MSGADADAPDAARGGGAPGGGRRHPGLNVAHPHAESERRNEANVFGFWIFLMSDAVVFALLLATYAVMVDRTAGGPTAAELFELPRALAETLLLLASSLAVGMAVLALKHDGGRRRGTLGWLLATLALGGAFLWLERGELVSLLERDAVPSRSGFLSAFFTLVGAHGAHVAIGLVWIAFLIVQIVVLGATPPVASRVLRLALYWHLLDVVWIAIFSFVYLAGLA